MKAAQLKVLCKEYGLKVSGKKADLIERIRTHIASASEEDDDVSEMSDEDLRDSLKVRGISIPETRDAMIEALRSDIEMANMLATKTKEGGVGGAVIEALERAAQRESSIAQILEELDAKEKKVPKFMELVVESLQLDPEKYTTGGAPSVTADVLRKLAGDPTADPPIYGSVSNENILLLCASFSSITVSP